MDGDHNYELRSRSRSRSHTPAIFNQMLDENESSEHHYELRSRESRERSHTPGEVTSSRRSGSRSLPGSATKSKEKSMETITEIREEHTEQSHHQIMLESEESAPPTVKKVERRSERQRIKRQSLTNGQGEAKERKSSVDKTENKSRKSITPKRTILTSDYSSEEGEREDPPSRPASAYEIYKQAGDYWNVFPKTDYTYSQASQCRYEIAPGILAMPNMSRPSIHSDGSSHGSSLSLNQQTISRASGSTREGNIDSLESEYNESIEENRLNEENARLLSATMRTNNSSLLGYKKVHVEEYTSRKVYYENRGLCDGFTQVDSDTEYDEAIETKTTTNRTDSRWRLRRLYESFKSVVSYLIISVVNIINTKILRRETRYNTSQGYYRYEETKWQKILSFLDHYLQHLYLWLIRILFLDTWILSRFSKIRQRILPHKTRLLWLLFLPPLLLAGCWLAPRALNLTLPNFTTDSIQTLTKREAPVPAVEIAKGPEQNLFLSEQLKKSIEILMNRVESLEASATNQNERLSNVNENIEDLRSNGKGAWEQYDKKLSALEQKLTDNNNNNNKDKKLREELATIKLEFNNLKQLYAHKKPCCDNLPSSADIQSQVEHVVASYLGTGAFKSEITKIVEEIVKSNTLISQKSEIIPEKENCQQSGETVSITDDYVRKIVRDVLKIYDADKTGRVDYALESAGGQVISIRCTQKYNVNTRAFKILGFTLFYESGDPRTVIQGHPLQPGLCWAFQDFPGYLLVKLRSPIKVTGFTLEHAPRSILPNNEMKSAPRRFNVWGLKEENDVNPVLFGEYEFTDSDESLQYFPVQNQEIVEGYDLVELRIHSNHGQLEYTCLYRFRIHGIPV